MTTSTPLLLCRPAGGLNDMLSQIDNACRYAELAGRTVVVETDAPSSFHFKDDFSHYFISRQPYLRLSAANYKHLFDTLDVYPKCLFGRVNSYAATPMREKQGYVDVETSTRLSFRSRSTRAITAATVGRPPSASTLRATCQSLQSQRCAATCFKLCWRTGV